MKKLNPVERSMYINDRYKEYLRSSFQFGNGKLQKLFQEQLEQEVLFKGPYVDLNLPFQRGKNLTQLIDEGVVCKSFSTLGDMNMTRPLYLHQEEAIRKIGSGRSAVITTGTGSGKTESFLFPILNDILKDIENGKNNVGIRAIFLYPMNALVNDQMDRVRKILTKCPDIKYGFFTGETKETVSKNYRQTLGAENNTFIPENELVSRKEIRETPPHLLFTNYSMLEYLLIRPGDFAIFEPERLNNWKYVVLDEAHSYYGSKGIEISLLMRRLTALAPTKPRFILTSATLGEKGKSENEIVDFAKNLTSAYFDIEDIIFSKRIKLNREKLQYRISGSDYILLKKNIKNFDEIKSIAGNYISGVDGDTNSILYELLLRDKNVFDVYEILKEGSKIFNYIRKKINTEISVDQLIALIDLINIAEKDGIGLFDLKYHSFVRPLSGAYITATKNPKLSLTKTNMIDGLKAFELGNCRYCNSTYIIGRIQYNDDDGLNYLLQNKEVDIYENYGNNKSVRLDYFLLENAINEEEVEKDRLEDYEICAKCGSIHLIENLNSKFCNCGNEYKFLLYKVKQNNKKDDDEFTTYNNIHQCPSCGHKGSKGGVVKSLDLGKDEGTALIAQILLEAMDEGDNTDKKVKKLSLKPKKQQPIEKSEKKVKQFLSFSDSRQQASFAAVFFNSNHVRMLRKRLIWNVIEKQGYRDVTVDEMVSYLKETIKNKNLFSNDMSYEKNAWVTILVDLLRIDGSNDGEGLGLYYFDLDLSEIEEAIFEEEVQKEFGEYGINKTDLLTIMQVVFSVFKVTPAINYVKSTLTNEDKKEHLGYRRFDNYIMYQCPKTMRGIRSFLPISSKSNMVVRYIEKACKCNSDEAKKLLDIIFNNLVVDLEDGGMTALLKKHENQEAFQVDVSRYIVKNYKNSKYYRCTKCGGLTPYNVNNVCVQDRCDGTLEEVDPDEVLKNNYYRNEYKNKKIERIVGKEHTAQINRDKAKKYQRDFKDKKINVLFCSTTFEMGIDIGDLETVFMRNIPPSPANYVQRAGRAGRRKDSSAYILTYCGTGSHDYTYFCEPEKMISGVIRPPYFNVLNKKIIIRHLMSACLGFFFRRNEEYFKTIDEIVFRDGKKAFEDYVNSHPEDLNRYINEKVLPEYVYKGYHNFKWFNDMGGQDEKMNFFVNDIQLIAKEYEEAKNKALIDEDYKEADYYTRQINRLENLNVLRTLSKYSVIPKYGFPVDVVELQVYKDGTLSNIDKQGRAGLSRDLKIAISEYAPDSEIIVDGEKYTSKYITQPKADEFPKHYFCTCPNCQKVNVYVSTRTADKCKYCGESISSVKVEYFIEPIYGFKTGITKESNEMKPKRSYAGEVSYLGGGIKDDNYIELGKSILVETSVDDELMILNRSSFYMCPVCGYSEIVRGRINSPQKNKEHKNYRQFNCTNDEFELLRIGHRFKTDVTRFTIPALKAEDKEDAQKAISFLYAFLEGVSNALEIERTDINGILELNLENGSYDILLYDDVPGGAGHVKRLTNENAIVNSLKSALNKVSQNCCDENTSCYNCLRNYYNQSYHSHLKRIYAKYVIELLLREITNVKA